jgi:putative membrane protein insertion efficiency factor
MWWISKIIGDILIKIIIWYQKLWSPDHSWRAPRHPYGYCRFTPTCSQYAIDAINKYGPIRGLLKTSWRLLRCNPFSKGGYDPA